MDRKLTAILSADVKGYSRLMGEDEEATNTLGKNRTRFILLCSMDDEHQFAPCPGYVCYWTQP